MINIISTDCNKTIEPLKSPFGFKGGYSNCIWTVLVKIACEEKQAYGHSIQGVLWSDGGIYDRIGEEGSNELMFSITSHLCEFLVGIAFKEPEDIFDLLFIEGMDYAAKKIGFAPRKTFILNALVPIDNALRMLYCYVNDKTTFLDFASDNGQFAIKQDKLALVPLITYNTTEEQIKDLADSGICIFKIKIGADPDNDNDKTKMLEQDKKRLYQIHQILKGYQTPYTDSGYVAYYLDANGRYDSIKRISELLEYAKKIGAFERIVLLEEPFDEHDDIDVSSLDVTVAADESVHDVEDAKNKIRLGYRAFALKPIAKTITVTNKIAQLALEKDIDVFCADLTVTPMLVEINKNYAARIPAITGMKIGIIESNGPQNYVNWDYMLSRHPMRNHMFVEPVKGIFLIDEDFYDSNGGIFETYANL